MQKLKKKAQLSDSVGAMIALTVGVGVAVLVFIFVGVLGGTTYETLEPDLDTIGDGASSAVEAATLLFPADGGTQLTYGEISVVTSFVNGSQTVPTTYYSVDLPTGAVTLLNVSYNNTGVNVTYSFANTSMRDPIKNSILSSFEALEATGSYMPLIVLAVIIVLILGIVLSLNLVGSGGGRSQVL